jgi:hypothetical protein
MKYMLTDLVHTGKFRKITGSTNYYILIAGMCKTKGTLSQENRKHDCIHYFKKPYYLHELQYKIRNIINMNLRLTRI